MVKINPSPRWKSFQGRAHSLQRVVGTELDAHQGTVIQYYKSSVTGGGTSKSNLISRKKYLEMLKTAIEDSLKIMGYDFNRTIVGHRGIHEYRTNLIVYKLT